MIEFGHARVRGVGVRVHQTGQDHPALQIQYFGARPAAFQYFVVASHLHDAAGLDGDGFMNGEPFVHGDDFAVMQNQVCIRGVGEELKQG